MKYVIFDFDGTLVDSKEAFINAWNNVAEKYQYRKLKQDDVENLKRISIKERAKQFNFPMYKLPIIMPQLYRYYNQSLKEIKLVEGIKELLEEIHANGFKIVIISSNAKENILSFLKQSGIEYVSDVLCSSRIFGKDKIISQFLKKNNLNRYDVIYVGDEQRDIIACHKVGIKMIWVGWGYDAIEVVKDSHPDYLVYTPQEILGVVQSN